MEKKTKQKKGRARRRRKIFLLVILFLIAAEAAVGALIYNGISIGISGGNIGYCLQGDELQISWLSRGRGTVYRLSRYDENAKDYVSCGEYIGSGAELTGVEPGKELKLKIWGVRTISLFGHDMEISGKTRMVTVVPEELDCPVLAKNADIEKKNVTITWDAEADNRYQVFLMNGEGGLDLYSEVEGGEIAFTEENRAELSGREQVLGVAVRALRRTDDYTLYGSLSNMALIERADLMEGMHLTCQKSGENRYTLSWQESKGDWYELQEWSYTDKKWISRQRCQWSDSLSYETGRLPSCTKMRFRVITYNSEEQRDKEIFAAEPAEVTFRTELSPVYCTIWPLKALDMTEDAAGGNVMGQVPAGKALCVLEEKEGRFLVRHEDEYGYIDSRYCMIDLSEYLGNLCKYDITNSYSSIFKVHGYDIPEITGTVIKGYENIHTADGNTLVPYLYPCAQKLREAALQAEKDGYYLCIYDAFRPNEATRYLYDSVEMVLDEEVQEEDEETEEGEETEESEAEESEETEETKETEEAEDVSGNDILTDEQMERINLILEMIDPGTVQIIKGFNQEALIAFYILPQEILMDGVYMSPEVSEGEYADVISALTPEDVVMLRSLPMKDIPVLKGLAWEDIEALKTYMGNVLTYRQVMTDNRFRLGSFLAQTVSTHNRGIALDLTLNDAATGEDLEMQSDMHDLSWYSILAQNNENADLLASYMKGAGYNGLSSEWWHFQDDETRNALGLGYLEKGVSPEGWKKDDLGWKYRLADGSCYYACTVMIEEKERTFDENGYLVEK